MPGLANTMSRVKKSDRIALNKKSEAKEKRFIIAVGRNDAKAFCVETTSKVAFPTSEESLVLTVEERYDFNKAGTKFNLFWVDTPSSKPRLVSGIFLKFVRSSAIANRCLELLEEKLTDARFDTSSRTISMDTEWLIKACDLDTICSNYFDDEQQEADDIETISEDQIPQMNKIAECIQLRKEAESIRLKQASSTFSLSASNYLTEDKLREILDEFGERLFQRFKKEITKGKEENVSELNNLSTVVDKRCKEILKKEDLLSADVKRISKFVDPSKIVMRDVIKAQGCLFSKDDKLTEWAFSNCDMKSIVNNIYKEASGSTPTKFFISLFCKMYGDLVCNFKLHILRHYDDSHRATRKRFDDFDPTGIMLLTDVTSKYFEKHGTDIIQKDSGDSISLSDFRMAIFRSLDFWGNKAFCKGVRTTPNVECLLFDYVHGEKHDNISNKEAESIIGLYKFLSIPKQSENGKGPKGKRVGSIALKCPQAKCSKKAIHNEQSISLVDDELVAEEPQ